jgi:glutamate synthase domain-containing protein 3
MTGGRIVVLGETGKNFAAGMSGGIAYIYNPYGNFEAMCNMGMVDLDPLEEDDIVILKGLIEEHMAYTGSTVASSILSDWENQVRLFTKVIPFDYKAVLNKKKENLKIAV